MRVRPPFLFATPLLFVLGACGCQQQAEPLNMQMTPTSSVTVLPEANNGAEGAIKLQRDMERKQAEADRKAGRKGHGAGQ